ncbi:OLC1v1026250C1 [Oldenlandia corymbosa var. corymbosa]|uniref:OLC1v1026250C1 n=1 Tax=Oldenlandia corymbosa var. corymbosa TaxID=529605 RepID=A0AAV1C8Q0_OLDCO|nr:OLC1v1026250C1 [Oldenlandia corymbosa var. corymbosa]
MKTISSVDEHCCCSSSAAAADCPASSIRPSRLIKPDPICQFGFPENKISTPLAYNMVSNSPSYSYSRFGDEPAGDDFPGQEIGWDNGDFVDLNNKKRPYMIRWKSGKRVDQRLMMVLESFYQEIYVKRQDFFKKIFPDRIQPDFEDVFRKVDAMLLKNSTEVKNKTLQRSLSLGSPRRIQRFKVKIPAVCIRNAAGQAAASACHIPAVCIRNSGGQGGASACQPASSGCDGK